MTAPNLVLIGAQKAGTSFLQACMGDHPEIFFAPNEISYFEDPDFDQTPRADFDALFSRGTGKRIVAFKRPVYFGKPEVPQRLRDVLPDIRIMIILRHPVERTLSAYYHYLRYGFLPLRGHERGLRALLGGESRTRYKRAREVLEFSLYGKHLQRYLSLFPKERISVYFFEELKKDSLAFVQRLYTHLGVSPLHRPAHLEERPQAGIYSLPRLFFLRLRNSFLYEYYDERTRLRDKPTGAIGKRICRELTGIDHFLEMRIKNEKPILSETLRRELTGFFHDDIVLLEELLGRDLSAWKS